MLLNQIAFSGRAPLSTSMRWYADGLGFLPSGTTDWAGSDIAAARGLDPKDVRLETGWMVDRSEFMQLKCLSSTETQLRPQAQDWTPADTGYNIVSVHVRDFDVALHRLAAVGTEPLTEPWGRAGERRACVQDPNGTLIELMERDPSKCLIFDDLRTEVDVAVRGIRATVPDLEASTRFFIDALGLWVSADHLHTQEHEHLWGLDGRTPRSVTLTDGRTHLELATYPETLGRPAGRRLSDEGVLNIAFGADIQGPYERTRLRLEHLDCEVHPELRLGKDAKATYITDAQGLGVEVMYMGPDAQRMFGFHPNAALLARAC